MSDQIIKCVECGRTFIWSYGEQRYYKERGLSPPKRCKACRARRRHEPDSDMGRVLASSGQAPPHRVPRQRDPAGWDNPVCRFGLVSLALAIALAALMAWAFSLDNLLSWGITINLVTALMYAYDKMVAGSGCTRVPERVLLLLALAGGTIGALLAMRRFRHKTAKGRFQFNLLLVALAQIVIIVAYYVFVKL